MCQQSTINCRDKKDTLMCPVFTNITRKKLLEYIFLIMYQLSMQSVSSRFRLNYYLVSTSYALYTSTIVHAKAPTM